MYIQLDAFISPLEFVVPFFAGRLLRRLRYLPFRFVSNVYCTQSRTSHSSLEGFRWPPQYRTGEAVPRLKRVHAEALALFRSGQTERANRYMRVNVRRQCKSRIHAISHRRNISLPIGALRACTHCIQLLTPTGLLSLSRCR